MPNQVPGACGVTLIEHLGFFQPAPPLDPVLRSGQGFPYGPWPSGELDPSDEVVPRPHEANLGPTRPWAVAHPKRFPRTSTHTADLE